MVTISILPYNPKKVLALILTLLGLATASCFADSLYVAKLYSQPMSRVQATVVTKAQVDAQDVRFFRVYGESLVSTN